MATVDHPLSDCSADGVPRRIIDADGAHGGIQAARALLFLRQLVMTGELSPNQRVLELWVVDRIGVSRTPVRAALARLSDEGFLRRHPSGGYAVRSFTEQDALDAVEVRGVLEGLAARRAAERGVSVEGQQAMRRLLHRIDALIAGPSMSLDDLANYSQLNEAFHLHITRECGGQIVPHQLNRIAATPFAHPSGFVMAQAQQDGTHPMFQLAQDHHWSVLSCLESGDGERAEAIMREHALLAARNLRLALERRPLGALGEGLHLIQDGNA